MRSKTKTFMKRFQERTSNLEHKAQQLRDKINSGAKRTVQPVTPSPVWIGDRTGENAKYTDKGSLLDFLSGKVKIKTYNERNERD
jgi:hypothetical protein